MSNSHTCQFCNHIFFLDKNTFFEKRIGFPVGTSFANHVPTVVFDENYSVTANLFRCPNCKKISTTIDYSGCELPNKSISIYPVSLAKQFPEYIPENIRQDYEEAYSILLLSPKASATLARRCLQGMIHDFWNIHEKNLNAEISTLQGKVSPSQWNAINALRSLGNIGAHMEHDVNKIVNIDSGEAEKLLKLIERLIESWYVQRYEEEKLYADIVSLDKEKQELRHS